MHVCWPGPRDWPFNLQYLSRSPSVALYLQNHDLLYYFVPTIYLRNLIYRYVYGLYVKIKYTFHLNITKYNLYYNIRAYVHYDVNNKVISHIDKYFDFCKIHNKRKY